MREHHKLQNFTLKNGQNDGNAWTKMFKTTYLMPNNCRNPSGTKFLGDKKLSIAMTM